MGKNRKKPRADFMSGNMSRFVIELASVEAVDDVKERTLIGPYRRETVKAMLTAAEAECSGGNGLLIADMSVVGVQRHDWEIAGAAKSLTLEQFAADDKVDRLRLRRAHLEIELEQIHAELESA